MELSENAGGASDNVRGSRFSFVEKKSPRRAVAAGKRKTEQVNRDIQSVSANRSPKSPVNIFFNKQTGDWLQMQAAAGAQDLSSTTDKSQIDALPKYMRCA